MPLRVCICLRTLVLAMRFHGFQGCGCIRDRTIWGNSMRRSLHFTLLAIVTMGLALLPGSSAGQEKTLKQQLVGAWTLVAVVGERSDGSKFEPFGANPKGIIIFT